MVKSASSPKSLKFKKKFLRRGVTCKAQCPLYCETNIEIGVWTRLTIFFAMRLSNFKILLMLHVHSNLDTLDASWLLPEKKSCQNHNQRPLLLESYSQRFSQLPSKDVLIEEMSSKWTHGSFSTWSLNPACDQKLWMWHVSFVGEVPKASINGYLLQSPKHYKTASTVWMYTTNLT